MTSDRLHIWHPFDHPALDAAPIFIERAEGAYLHRSDAPPLLDAISSWWVTLHGHAHPAIARAIAEQARRLEQVIFAGFTHAPAEELAIRLRKFLPPRLEHIFFSDDGSTAVEVALKMAVQYWWNLGQREKQEIVALQNAYHGDTLGALSAGAESVFSAPFESLRLPVHRVHSAYCFRCPVGLTRERCQIDCLDKLRNLLAERSGRIATVIVEPLLQGAGGMIVHPVEFLQGIRQLCSEHNVLLIADEVLTGFGRCGKMFACELAGVAPDLMCVAKGLTGGFLPLAATLCTQRVYDAFLIPDRARTFFHGHSYTANPIACAAANANLEIFATEPVFDRIGSIAQIHKERLAKLKDHAAIADVRSIGTVAAMELRSGDPGYLSSLRTKLYDFYLQKGVLLRPLGNVVYILPPYCITTQELHHVYDVIVESLSIV
jgi:adenosylmethionine---8-amino-7-oxononanoate aminotransferase